MRHLHLPQTTTALKRTQCYEPDQSHEVIMGSRITYLEVSGAVETDPLETERAGLHLCQICIVEPYRRKRILSRFSSRGCG